MANDENHSATEIQQWIAGRLNEPEIEKKLRAAGYDEAAIALHLRDFIKRKRARRQAAGFTWSGSGALLGFISCLLALINPLPSMHDLFLYGLTSAAILLIFIGLYLLLE